MQKLILFIFLIFMFISCEKKKEQTLFSKMEAKDTGIEFENRLQEDEQHNVMTYEYFYNGGGLAVGDLNNDGLPDIYLSGNTVPNKLFLNKGNWKFQDITSTSKVSGRKGWKTGVTMADVNGDGKLDIYVSYSGNAPQEGFDKPVIRDYPGRTNQLFINQGNNAEGIPVFKEEAKAYGLDAIGTFSTQAYFFDYDLDGDLDMFLLNHANKFYSAFYNTKKLRSLRHPYFGNKLYQNQEGKFIEVTENSGIHGSGINFGLSASISDINKDGFPDIYVTNDYEEQDFYYVNNGDGTFTDESHKSFVHLSKFGMGSDIADINNDELPDIFVADMLPEDNYRQKVLQGPDMYNQFKKAVDSGYHYQYMRNTLQVNNGMNQDSVMQFSETGQLAGISNTDWSWAPLLADFDNDGLKDLFITNGFLRDYSNLDFRNYTANEAIRKANSRNQQVDLLPLIQQIPSTKVSNYFFRNIDGTSFQNQSEKLGLGEKTVSNAAAYADLDNDGDLDLIVNNLNSPVLVYQNNQETMLANHFLKIRLEGDGKNSMGIGSKIILSLEDGQKIYQEAFFGRGYQSSVEPVLTIGLGKHREVKNVKVIWPSGKISEKENVKTNSSISFSESESKRGPQLKLPFRNNLLTDISKNSGIDFEHKENDFIDFNQRGLLPYQMSRLGGKASTGDIDGDGYEDIYFGGARGQSGVLYYGNANGNFTKNSSNQAWAEDADQEDLSSLMLDLNNDGKLDLYVVSGGNELPENDPYYQDRIYLNKGNRSFEKLDIDLPTLSGQVIASSDFDQDGDIDIFIGGRLKAENYPLAADSYLLKNESIQGEVKFEKDNSALFTNLGMVTAVTWVDINGDSWEDLIVVGEWMNPKIFMNDHGKLSLFPAQGLKNLSGWWQSILADDFDGDGDVDVILGNMGENSQLEASEKEPMRYYIQDIDKNGEIDPIFSCFNEEGEFPIFSRDEVFRQVSSLKKIYTSYDKYAKATTKDILKEAGVSPTEILEITTLKSIILENTGNMTFKVRQLPAKLQASVINGFAFEDFDNDGEKEILAAGNFFPFRVSLGKMDAFNGALISFKDRKVKVERDNMGLYGDIRDLKILTDSDNLRILVVRNDDKASLYKHVN
ncbi:MAG: VCBS repeat-containing protein [Christiangramia sp.]